MSYRYEVEETAPFAVRITGSNYNCLYPFNPDTNTEFTSYDNAETWAQGMIYDLENPPSYEIWYHLDVTGGDGKTPVGILNDGVQSVTVTVTARESADPASNIRPINDTFRMEIRTQDGYVYDVVLFNFVNGVGSITYTDDNPKGNLLTVSLPENLRVYLNDDGTVDVGPIIGRDDQLYSSYLTGETQFIVYRMI